MFDDDENFNFEEYFIGLSELGYVAMKNTMKLYDKKSLNSTNNSETCYTSRCKNTNLPSTNNNDRYSKSNDHHDLSSNLTTLFDDKRDINENEVTVEKNNKIDSCINKTLEENEVVVADFVNNKPINLIKKVFDFSRFSAPPLKLIETETKLILQDANEKNLQMCTENNKGLISKDSEKLHSSPSKTTTRAEKKIPKRTTANKDIKLKKSINNWLDAICLAKNDYNTNISNGSNNKYKNSNKINTVQQKRTIQSKLTLGKNGKITFVKDATTIKNKITSANENSLADLDCGIETINKQTSRHIKELDKEAIDFLTTKIDSEQLLEICFCIIYKEGMCQLDDTFNNENRTAVGILICLNWNEPCTYFYLTIRKKSSIESSLRWIVNKLMNCQARKICYESLELMTLLINVFNFSRIDICLKWMIIDPKIGCFLLNPDEPPSSFFQILKTLNITPPAVHSNCLKLRTAHYMDLLSECCREMYLQLSNNSIWHVFINIETHITPMLTLMELRGMCIDTKLLIEMSNILEKYLKQIEHNAVEILGRPFQLNSTVQIRKIIYDELNLGADIKVKETKMGKKSTSESVLCQMTSLHPLPALILNYRHVNKAKSTFIDAILKQSKSGVIKATWDQTSTATGRISSSEPNLQAIPKGSFKINLFPVMNYTMNAPMLNLREAFIARPFHCLVAADFQQIECRIFSHLANDKILINIVQENFDIFKSLAMHWLKKSSIDDVSEDDREKTKKITYALMYGAGIEKLMGILQLKYDEVQSIVTKFYEAFPVLKSFRCHVLAKCRSQNGVLRSLSGRIRRFCHINSTDYNLRSQAERQAINFIIQGSAADLCKTAMIATDHRLTNSKLNIDYHLLLQIHDELVWEVPEEHVEKFTDIVQEVMQTSGEFCGGLSIPLPVIITKGKSWGQMT